MSIFDEMLLVISRHTHDHKRIAKVQSDFDADRFLYKCMEKCSITLVVIAVVKLL